MVATNSVMLPLGTPAPDFSLVDTVTGRMVSRADFVGAPLLVLFLCNHCPYVQFIRSALATVTRTYLARGVAVVGISTNDAEAYPADGPLAMQHEAVSADYAFPYLYDADHRVAIAYHAACTPDLMLFDHDHRLFYRGQFCSARRKVAPLQIPTGEDITAAVAAVLAKAPPPTPQRASIGCNIKWKPGCEPAYFQATIVR